MNERFVRCSRCHTINPTDASSCRKCGFSLSGHETAPEPEKAEEPVPEQSDTIDSVELPPPRGRSDSFDGSIGDLASQDLSGEWELGDIKGQEEEDFSVGHVDLDEIEQKEQEKAARAEEEKKQKEKLGTWINGSQAARELKAQQTVKTHTDRREALVESLKTIQSVLRRKKDKAGPLNETVNAMGSDPMTIENSDPFSELLVKQTVNRDHMGTIQQQHESVRQAGAEPSITEAPVQEPQIPEPGVIPETNAPAQQSAAESSPPAMTAADTISRRYGVPVSPTETFDSAMSGSMTMGSMTTRGFGDEVDVAGFWIRAGAYAIDVILLSIPIFLMTYFGVSLAGHESPMVWLLSYQGQGALITIMVMWLMWFLLYFTMFTWLGGSTPGKMITGLKIIDWFGETPVLAKAFLRSLMYLLDAALFGLGFFWVIISSTRQAFHDKLVGTLVVRD